MGIFTNIKGLFQQKSVSKHKELGESGVIQIDGLVESEEYNKDLTGEQGLETWEKMRRGDGSVKSALLAIKLPITKANWIVKPASSDPKDVEIAAFIRANLLETMSTTWIHFIRQSLRYLDYGSFVFEKVYTSFEHNGREYIGLKKLAPRLPRTIERWQTEDGKPGITQTTPTGKRVSIPIEKLLILVNDQLGDDWWGESILRAAYKHWYMKDKLYRIDAIKHERMGLGIPYFKRPAGAASRDRAQAKKVLSNLRAHERANLEIPEGWEIGFMDMNVKSVSDPIPSIEHHDAKIVQSVLAQFLHLGQSGTGSYALAQSMTELFFLGVKAVSDEIAEGINRHVIPQLVHWNFDGVKDLPKLQATGINALDNKALTEALSSLAGQGMIKPNASTEQHLRRIFELPEIDEEMLAAMIEQEKAEVLDGTKQKPDTDSETALAKKEQEDDREESKKVTGAESTMRKLTINTIGKMERQLHDFITRSKTTSP